MTRREKIAVAVMIAAGALFALLLILPWKNALASYDADVVNAVEMTLTRLLGGIVFLAVIVYLEFPVLRPFSRPFGKTFHTVLPFWIVAVNNFPFLSVFSGAATVSFTLPRTALLAAEYLAVALFEECAFRGVLLPLLLDRFRTKPHRRFRALLVSSLIFGLIHLVNLFYGGSPAAVLLQVGYSFLIGGMCGIAFLVSSDVWLPVALHAVYDFCGAAVPFLGSGTIWTTPTVILTAVLGILALAYALWWVRRDAQEDARGGTF